MRKLIWILGLVAILPGTAARAQLADPGSVGVAMGHVHFAVQDMDAAKKFWIAVGGKPASKLGANEVVKFPGVLILIRKAMDPTAGTVGSTVNHIGFLVPNVAEARAKWMAAGLTMEPPNPANAKQIYLHSPDDLVRVEILEDAMQTVPIKFHHVHFFVADTGSTNSVLAIQASDTPTVGTKGRELDHIGFEIKGLEAFCKKAEAAGIKLDMPYTPRPDLGIALAFVTDPWGTYIELNEGLSKL